MAQHDYVIANQSGSSFRSDLNNALSAIVSQNSGSSEPSTTYAYQTWADTTNGVMKMRNGANSGWITLYQLDGEWSTIALENGTAGAPSIYFKDSGTDTGIYSPGTDQVAISTGGTGRLFIDSSGRVGLGTSSPSAAFHVASSTSDPVLISNSGSSAYNSLILRNDASSQVAIGIGGSATGGAVQDSGYIGTISNRNFFINTNNQQRVAVTAAGLVGIGTTSPGTRLCTYDTGVGNNSQFRVGFSDTFAWDISRDNGSTGDLTFKNSSGGAFTERARIDSSGRLLVGTSSARANLFNSNASPQLQVEGDTFSKAGLALIGVGDTYYDAGTLTLCHGRGGSVGSNTILQNGAIPDILGYISFQGNDGSEFVEGASIKAETDGTLGANDMPSKLVFSTTADGASSPTERMRITKEGWFAASQTGSIYSTTAHNFAWNSAVRTFFHHSSATAANAFGIEIMYASSPNGTGNEFLFCTDTNGNLLRASIRSNGGIANYSANNINLSDRNVKKDITPATGTWDCLKEWEIVNFRYKDQPDDADLNMGVIAQQVAESCPEVITVFQEAKEATEDQPAQEERIGVKEQQMMWMAIKALQEAQLRIETLEAEVAALKAS